MRMHQLLGSLVPCDPARPRLLTPPNCAQQDRSTAARAVRKKQLVVEPTVKGKRCNRCYVDKPVSEFPVENSLPSGRKSRCKVRAAPCQMLTWLSIFSCQ